MINNMTTHFQLLLGLFKLFFFWSLSPQSEETSFDGWWAWTNDMVSGQVLQGLNSIVILGAWMLWNHRKRCVFDGGSPYLHCALLLATEEMKYWSLAGAKGLSFQTSSVIDA